MTSRTGILWAAGVAMGAISGLGPIAPAVAQPVAETDPGQRLNAIVDEAVRANLDHFLAATRCDQAAMDAALARLEALARESRVIAQTAAAAGQFSAVDPRAAQGVAQNVTSFRDQARNRAANCQAPRERAPQTGQAPLGEEKAAALLEAGDRLERGLSDYEAAVRLCDEAARQAADDLISQALLVFYFANAEGALPPGRFEAIRTEYQSRVTAALGGPRMCPPDAGPQAAVPPPADVEDLDRIADDPQAGLRSEGLAPSEPRARRPLPCVAASEDIARLEAELAAAQERYRRASGMVEQDIAIIDMTRLEERLERARACASPSSPSTAPTRSVGVSFGIGSVNIPGLVKDSGEPPRDDDPEERVTVRTYGVETQFGGLGLAFAYGEGSKTRFSAEGPDFRGDESVNVRFFSLEGRYLISGAIDFGPAPAEPARPRLSSYAVGQAVIFRRTVTDRFTSGTGPSAFEFEARDRIRDTTIGLGFGAEFAAPIARGLIFYAEGQAVPYVVWSNLRGVTTVNGTAGEPFEESRSGIGVRGGAESGVRYAISPGIYVSAAGFVDHRTRAGSFESFGPDDRLPSGDMTHYGFYGSATFSF